MVELQDLLLKNKSSSDTKIQELSKKGKNLILETDTFRQVPFQLLFVTYSGSINRELGMNCTVGGNFLNSHCKMYSRSDSLLLFQVLLMLYSDPTKAMKSFDAKVATVSDDLVNSVGSVVKVTIQHTREIICVEIIFRHGDFELNSLCFVELYALYPNYRKMLI